MAVRVNGAREFIKFNRKILTEKLSLKIVPWQTISEITSIDRKIVRKA
jgi:hypothetical protein